MNLPWWKGAILWIIPFLSCGYLMVKAQIKFIKLYGRKKGVKTNLTNYLYERYTSEPQKWFFESPIMSWYLFKIIWKNYSDEELNEAAIEVRKYFWLTIAAMFLLFPLPLIFS